MNMSSPLNFFNAATTTTGNTTATSPIYDSAKANAEAKAKARARVKARAKAREKARATRPLPQFIPPNDKIVLSRISDIRVYISGALRQLALNSYVFGETEGDKLPVFLLTAQLKDHVLKGERIKGEIIDLLMTERGEIVSINDEPVSPLFCSQQIQNLRPIASYASPFYSHYTPAG